jgi:hypothetical protein
MRHTALTVLALSCFGTAWPDDANPALNVPDQLAWVLFAQLNQKAQLQAKVGPRKLDTNDSVWETWADDDQTFPARPSPASPPTWPGAGARRKNLVVPNQQRVHRERLRFMGGGEGAPQPIPDVTPTGTEEVRRNQVTFDYIVSNGLYYTQGLKAAFQKGVPLSFPVDSVEVKANWVPITEDQKPRYHWNYDSNGNLYGMVAMHLMTRLVPNWTWATFEWVNNAGRCDSIGCHDDFGVTPPDVAPNPQTGGAYPPGRLTPQVLTVLEAAGVPAEFQNYRLKGTQTDFTDPMGRHTLLGNSVTEAGFVETASCMTCHTRSSVDQTGTIRPGAGFAPNNQSYNGAPDPAWFFDTSTTPWTANELHLDFVWGFIAASPAVD